MASQKSILLFFLLFPTLIVQAQKTNDPLWFTMMQDPKVNFYKAKEAHQDYWKNQKVPPVKELHDMKEAAAAQPASSPRAICPTWISSVPA